MEIKVTPEMEVPIIPIATKIQGALRPAKKKELLSALRLVRQATTMSIAKYAIIRVAINPGESTAANIDEGSLGQTLWSPFFIN
jgi:hypothetical protein